MPRSGSVRSARYRRDLAARLVALDVRPPRAPRRPWTRRPRRRRGGSSAAPRRIPVTAAPSVPTTSAGASGSRSWNSRATASSDGSAPARRRSPGSSSASSRSWASSGTSTTSPSCRRAGCSPGSTARATSSSPRRWPTACSTISSRAEVAALVSTIVFESRERVPPPAEMPNEHHRRSLPSGSKRVWRRVRRRRGPPPGRALPGARCGVRRARVPMGRGRTSGGRAQRDGDVARRLRPHLQAAPRPPPPDRGRGTGGDRPGRPACARCREPRGRRLYRRLTHPETARLRRAPASPAVAPVGCAP